MIEIKNTDMYSKAIGIFDSGVGGLSIMQEITKQLPNENLVYVADNLHAPYGDKSQEEIKIRVLEIGNKLINLGVKAIVVACNTATVSAIDVLRASTDIPVIGVEPAIKPAAKLSKNKKIGILVTRATAKNKRFSLLIDTHKNGAEVFIQPCPGLVEHIETGIINTETTRDLLSEYLQPLLDNNVDTIVLGCTHYPFVSKSIKSIVKNNMTLMDTAKPVTEQLIRQLNKYNLLNVRPTENTIQVLVSKQKEDQCKTFSNLLGFNVNTQKLT